MGDRRPAKPQSDQFPALIGTMQTEDDLPNCIALAGIVTVVITMPEHLAPYTSDTQIARARAAKILCAKNRPAQTPRISCTGPIDRRHRRSAPDHDNADGTAAPLRHCQSPVSIERSATRFQACSLKEADHLTTRSSQRLVALSPAPPVSGSPPVPVSSSRSSGGSGWRRVRSGFLP